MRTASASFLVTEHSIQRTAFGDHPATVQGTIAFLHFDEKINARRAVQLIHDDALGAVDDELAAADLIGISPR